MIQTICDNLLCGGKVAKEKEGQEDENFKFHFARKFECTIFVGDK